jgi:3-hydroxyisobutyrate dehydrogenase-like beta-hydroxyacid dehydrogenase
MDSIGVIGLGIIGRIWARHYEAAGVLAGVWNRSPQPGFPRWQPTPGAVAQAARVVQIVVADPPAVASVLAKILPHLGAGKIVVQSSTIDPASSERFHGLVTATGARYLEAPFTGSKPAAEARQTVYFLGGEPELAAEVGPLLALVAETRLLIGTPRQAATLKLALNLNIALQMEALAESLVFARRAGVGDAIFFGALAKNAGYSGLTKLKEAKLRTADFSPQFSVKHMHKDLRLAAQTAQGPDAVPPGAGALPLLETVRERLRLAEAAGWGDEDFSALIKLLPG